MKKCENMENDDKNSNIQFIPNANMYYSEDHDKIISHLRSILSNLNYETKQCACCSWVDDDELFTMMCCECHKSICQECYKKYGNNCNKLICEDCKYEDI